MFEPRRTGRTKPVTPGYVPPGWPEGVLPPGVPGWEASASAFLFDHGLPEDRLIPVLQRHPVVLARFVGVQMAAQSRAAREGLSQVRASLGEYVGPETMDAAVAAWQRLDAAVAGQLRQVLMVEEALRGRTFVRKL